MGGNSNDATRDDDRDEVVYRGTWEAESVALSTCVAEALSSVIGNSPTLYDVIDPDALDALFGTKADGTPRDRGRVSFDVGDYLVTVNGDGTFVVALR